jgi:hypothetical protein
MQAISGRVVNLALMALQRQKPPPSNPRFYEELPGFDDFARITEASQYRLLPEDWHVAIADVERSTAAIGAGLYKQVNVVGAASIVAVLNAIKPLRVPFVFGGDGATLCVPDSVVGPVREALRATKRLAQEEFHLALRVGIVPVPEIHAAGHRVLVARCRVSAHYTQAVFTGGGLAFAEACLKDPEQGRRSRLELTGTLPLLMPHPSPGSSGCSRPMPRDRKNTVITRGSRFVY